MGAQNLSRGKRRKVKREGGLEPTACGTVLIAAYCSLLRSNRTAAAAAAAGVVRVVVVVVVVMLMAKVAAGAAAAPA